LAFVSTVTPPIFAVFRPPAAAGAGLSAWATEAPSTIRAITDAATTARRPPGNPAANRADGGVRAAAAGLVRPRGVVLAHPSVQGRLQLPRSGEQPVVRGEELRPHRLVQPWRRSIDAGHDLDLEAAAQVHPAHHIHLPQLHRSRPLPAPVILPPPLALPRHDQPVPDQRPVHTQPARYYPCRLS
jgi:hypothetical protein